MVGSIKQECILGKRIFIYLPPSYEENKRFPVLYSNDGEDLYRYSETLIESFEEGFKHKTIQEFIWIGIYADKRLDEYTPWKAPALVSKFDDFGGLGNQYIEFIESRLKTYIDENYNTKSDDKNTWIMGYSLGGLISVYSAYISSSFGKIACICGSFWYKDMVKFVSNNTILNDDLKLFIHYGQKEGQGKNTAQKDAVNCVEQVIEAINKKAKKTIVLKASSDDGGHHQYLEERYRNAIAWLASK